MVGTRVETTVKVAGEIRGKEEISTYPFQEIYLSRRIFSSLSDFCFNVTHCPKFDFWEE
jgi:hypothetical protein